jgi:hypothetical protein
MTVSPSSRASPRITFAALIVAWGGLVALSAATGVTQALPTVLVPVPIALLLATPLVLYTRSERLQSLVAAEDVRWLTAFHAWRVPAGVAFLWYGSQGDIPLLFALIAGWGDVAAGLLAVAAVVRYGRGTEANRRGYVGFHLFGMLDFVVAVGTGFAFSVLGNPLMGAVQELPLVLIVFFGVPVTGALGLMTLHRLVRAPVEMRASPPSESPHT